MKLPTSIIRDRFKKCLNAMYLLQPHLQILPFSLPNSQADISLGVVTRLALYRNAFDNLLQTCTSLRISHLSNCSAHK